MGWRTLYIKILWDNMLTTTFSSQLSRSISQKYKKSSFISNETPPEYSDDGFSATVNARSYAVFASFW